MNLKFWRCDLQLTHRWAVARGRGSDLHRVVIVELGDADGIVGLGEAAPSGRRGESVDSVMAFCARVNGGNLSFADVPGSMAYLDTVAPGHTSAKCAFNVVLLDGAAKRARMPLHDFLGFGFREHNHITSFSIGIDEPDVIRQKVHAAENYPVLKLKVGVAGDKANFAALREAAPDKPVRVDANEGWKTKEQALERIEWLAQDGHIQFVEQPLPANTSAADWVWLKQRSPLPIFADESYRGARDTARCAECFHGVNVKLVKVGGITAGLDAL